MDMASWKFWAQWGLAAVFAGILLIWVLRRLTAHLRRIEDKVDASAKETRDRLEALDEILDFIYYKLGGVPERLKARVNVKKLEEPDEEPQE